MLLIILIIFSGALLAAIIDALLKKWTGIIVSLIPLGVFIHLLSLAKTITNGDIVQSFHPWVSSLNINITFYLDGLSFLFALLVVGIGFFVLVYSNSYMQGKHLTGRYYAYMLFFMGSMLGLVTSGNLIGIYVFWELTSVSSFLLISLHHREEKSRAAGLQALLVTTFGGLAVMAGFVLIGMMQGSYELSELLTYVGDVSGHPLYLPVVLLILLGAFTKSAQFPFHFWLPSAMAAPTPVSAYLHSAAMVNAGIYLIARLNPLLGNTALWQNIIVIVGLLTMFVGAYFTLTQKDLKRILAYATVSALGILMLLFGIGSDLAVKAALLYLIVHAFYKASLFMVAGIIDKKTGTRDIYQLGNLWKKLPVTTGAAILALASMASLPPMMGYISKKLIFEAKVDLFDEAPYLLILGFTAFLFLFAVSLLVVWQVFFKKENEVNKIPKKAGFAYLLGPVVLSALSFVMAVFPDTFEKFIEFSAESVKGHDINVNLKLWHGINNVFLLSLLSMVLGTLLFLFRKKIIPAFQWINKYFVLFELANVFLRFINGLLKFTKEFTRIIQHGYHRFYLMVVFVVAALFLGADFIVKNNWEFDRASSPVSLPFIGIVIISAVASLTTVFTKSKITAIITMGVVGFSLGIFFLINGAVDVAITFIIVDTLTLVLFVLVTLKLPEFEKYSHTRTRIRDGFVALTFGAVMFMAAMVASHTDKARSISGFYLEKSLPEGFGKNVVNVILVDFRALDTLGEVIVLLLAAVSIYALLKLKSANK